MHGRVSYYSDKSGTGTLTNQHRRVFEFNKKSWHDPKSLPEREMYVDFRVDEKGKVASCRESVFKKLKITHGIREEDFWESADDKILEDIAKNLKDEAINSGVNSIDPKKPIKITKTIDECFDMHFSDQIEMVYRYEELLVEPENYKYVDYLKMKRFLQKAKTQLLSTDATISHENFAQIEQELTQLEYLLAETLRAIRTDVSVMFDELFLNNQITYLRAKRRLAIDKERVFQLENMTKKSKFDIDLYKQRAKRETKEELKAVQEEKVANILKNRVLWKKEIELKSKHIEMLKSHIVTFEKVCFTEFINGYNFEREEKKVYSYLKKIMDYVAYVFDFTIWKLATESKPIENSFYSQKSEGSFNAFTFLRYYMRPLDKLRLTSGDRALYNYLLGYERKHSAKFLVISEEQEFSKKIRTFLFNTEKDYLVYQFPRAIDSMQWVKGNSVDILLIDSSIFSLSVYEYLKYFNTTNKNSNVMILCFMSEDKVAEQDTLKKYGVHLFLKKPLNIEKFKEVVVKISKKIKDEANEESATS